MDKHEAFAPGKIILTGEYAVVFGYPGIAVPSTLGMNVTFKEDLARPDLNIDWRGIRGDEKWMKYLHDIVEHCQEQSEKMFFGTLTIENDLPLGKGMGSSTSLVVSVTRCLLGKDCKNKAMEIEDAMNPGHSGIDFAVIWNAKPIFFQHEHSLELIDLPKDLLSGGILIDTETPNETTPELVSWVEARREELKDAFEIIGHCTEKLKENEDLKEIIRKHHQAQIALGIVPKKVQKLITLIEGIGASAKIIGAGGRTGGGGIVLALHDDRSALQNAIPDEFPTFDL